jgi:hypothetical protein
MMYDVLQGTWYQDYFASKSRCQDVVEELIKRRFNGYFASLVSLGENKRKISID